MSGKRVLIVSYSYSHQTRSLLQKLALGLEEGNAAVTWEVLTTEQELRFPIGSVLSTLRMMVQTFFRRRYPVKPVPSKIFCQWDLIVLAGPTWSYNPSGAVLSFLDRDGKRLFKGQDVLPLISCRGYWRIHFWGLRALLQRCGVRSVASPIVFTHPTAEPWNTIGVFLKLAGKMPERGKGWFRRYYPKYGHSRKQIETAYALGVRLGQDLNSGIDPSRLVFETPVPTERI